tara:strand:+ start:3158 stop:6256 length:3099 start_codon:yes stop_codon:yes gene_type:complete
MAGPYGKIQNMIKKAKKSTDKFLITLKKTNSQILIGSKQIDVAKRQETLFEGGKKRAELLKDIDFFKDPSVMTMISMLKSLNSFELCNPASFAIDQGIKSIQRKDQQLQDLGGEGTGAGQLLEKFENVQGKLREVFNVIRNFSLTPGETEVTGVTTSQAVPISRSEKVTITLPPRKNNKPYAINNGTVITLRTTDPKTVAHMTGTVETLPEIQSDERGQRFVIGANNYTISIDTASTSSPPKDKQGNVLTFINFNATFTKEQNPDIQALAGELSDAADLLREIGFQDIVNDLKDIPPKFPGLSKIRELAIKLQNFFDGVGTASAQLGDEVDDASQFLSGGYTTRQVLEGSRLFAEFNRRLEPILNLENSIVSGYKDVIENVNSILRDVIPFQEISKFITFIRDFVRVIQGVVSMILVLLKTINGIIKVVMTILKVFKVVLKVVKLVVKVLPAMFLPVGVITTFTEKIENVEGAIGEVIEYLAIYSEFLQGVIDGLQFTKYALKIVIEELTKLAAKLGSCGALKGNGMEASMTSAVSLVRDSLRGLTQAAPDEDFYPDDPNSPGGGLGPAAGENVRPYGTGPFIQTPGGEIMFLSDSIIGFDEDGNLIFFANLTSLSTGVRFNSTLGQDFRNRNLRFYTFDKFRNSQASMLNEADRIAEERRNAIKEIDPTDRFGNFAEKYKGYTIKIQEEIDDDDLNTQIVTRRRGIALDSAESLVVSTDLTFSDNLSQIVNEVKFQIDQLIQEGVIGINTSDPQANTISDDDAIDIAEGTGANPVAINNLRAQKNNKAAASIPDKPGKPVKSRIGNQPFESNRDLKIPSRGKTDGGSPSQPIRVEGVAQAGIDAFVESTPELKSLANNLSTINRATTSQLSNILRDPGVQNMSEEELVQKLRGEILSGVDPNPDRIEEVKDKTQEWYRGIRAQARVDFNQLVAAQQQTSTGNARGKGAKFRTSGKPKPEFEPFVTKIELKEIPKWIELLRRNKYTQSEIDAGLSGEGIRDKYEIKVDEDGKIDIRKKLAFKNDNFEKKKRG